VPAVLAYSGAGRRLVQALKFRSARPLVGPLATAMAALVVDAAIDVVTWAPTSASRRRRRGYDQAELLARAVARRLGCPCRPLLRRAASAGPQTGATRAARLLGPAFHARTAVRGRVLVVDDVVTTGATLTAAASALQAAGASAVLTVAAAATP
jgi:predicted amidophosphoribosyltransferase